MLGMSKSSATLNSHQAYTHSNTTESTFRNFVSVSTVMRRYIFQEKFKLQRSKLLNLKFNCGIRIEIFSIGMLFWCIDLLLKVHHRKHVMEQNRSFMNNLKVQLHGKIHEIRLDAEIGKIYQPQSKIQMVKVSSQSCNWFLVWSLEFKVVMLQFSFQKLHCTASIRYLQFCSFKVQMKPPNEFTTSYYAAVQQY